MVESNTKSSDNQTKRPTAMVSMKRKRPGDTQSLESLSLTLKMKCLVVEAHMTNMNHLTIERNIVSIANELALLFVFGIQNEDTCFRFLTSAFDKIAKLMQTKSMENKLRTTPDEVWRHAKARALSVDDSDVNMNGCYETTLDDISVFWNQMQAAKDKAAALWNEDKLQEAMPYLRAADSYFKRLHLKFQKLNLDYAIIGSKCPPSPKKVKSSRVSFSDSPIVMGTAAADVDRSPICPSKPTPLEALLLRASREFPMPSF